MKVGEAKKQKWVVDIVSILQSETTCQTNRASCVYCLMQGGRAHATVHALQSISAGLKGAGYRRGHTFRWVTDAVCHTAELSLQLCVSVNLIFMEGGIRGGSLCNGSCCHSDLRWGDRGRLWIPLDLASVSLCHCLREPQWMVLFSTKIRIAVHSTQLCNKILLSNMAVPWDYSCPPEQPHLVVRVIDRAVIRCQNSFSFSAFRPSTHDTVFHIHRHHSYTNNWQTKIFYFCL